VLRFYTRRWKEIGKACASTIQLTNLTMQLQDMPKAKVVCGMSSVPCVVQKVTIEMSVLDWEVIW
jgi:hypothetical protein